MEKRYLVTGNWIDKNTGKPLSGIAEISGGINKSGLPYEIADTGSREAPIDGTYPIGTVLMANVNLAVQENVGKGSQEQRNVKINS